MKHVLFGILFFLTGSISIATLDKLILVNLPLVPELNTLDEANYHFRKPIE